MRSTVYSGYSKAPTTLAKKALALPQEVTRKGLRATLKQGQRVFFVGHTGSGKTYLATKLIEDVIPPLLPVVVIDPKHGFHEGVNAGSAWEIMGDLPRRWESIVRHPKRPRHLRLIIQPEFMEDPRHNATLNDIYTRVFNLRRCLVYLDEIQALCFNSRASTQLAKLVQMGRQPRISVWGSTLRPSGIPRMFLSENDHMFCFRLRDEDDRKRVSQVIGEWGVQPPGPGEYDFWYMPPGVGSLEPILVHQ